MSSANVKESPYIAAHVNFRTGNPGETFIFVIGKSMLYNSSFARTLVRETLIPQC